MGVGCDANNVFDDADPFHEVKRKRDKKKEVRNGGY